VEHDLTAVQDTHFIAQAMYLRQPAGSPVTLERTVEAISRVLPNYVESVGGDTVTVPDWATFGRDEVPDDAGAHGKEAGDPVEEPSVEAWATVVHLVAAVPESPSQDDISAAFDECLDLVHTTHRGLHHVFGEPIQLPTPEAAPLGVAMVLQVITERGLEPRWPAGLFMLNRNFIPTSEEMTPAQLSELEGAEVKDASHRPMSLVLDLRREALAAAHLTGDTRTAVVMAATTCETFIDVTLSALLWEEGLTPEDGAVELEQYRDAAERLWRLVAPRLGGSWDLTTQPALRDWRNTITMNRNRVVHAGGLPGGRLAQAACDAMFPFIGYVFDRLCDPSSRTKYPMTALIIAARSALEARGGWTRKMRSAADEADELDLQGVFARWYGAASELRLPIDARRKGQSGDIKYVVTESGNSYWVEHDTSASQARTLSPSGDVALYIQAALEQPHPRGGTYSFSATPACRVVGDWVPEHRLIPGIALMRFSTGWYEPVDAPASLGPGDS
jgi:hypothetical protein